MEYFIKLIKKKHGKDVSSDVKAVQKLRREAERAKRSLSNQHQVRVEIESLYDGIDFSEPLTRARFEELNNDLFRKTMGPVRKAMEDAGMKKTQIDEIVLVGGSTRIPKVQALLKEYFDGKEPNKGVNPDEAVQIHQDVQSRFSVGMHWGTFLNLTDEPSLEPSQRLKEVLTEKKLSPESFITVKHGQTLGL